MSKNTSKTKAVKAGKRVKKTAAKTKPLSSAEFDEIDRLITYAAASNRELLTCSRHLGDAREQLRQAQSNLTAAENAFNEAMQEHAEVHTKLAPLFHRLPA